MDLDAAKARIADLQQSLEAAISFFESLGLDPARLEETTSLLARMQHHLEVLDSSTSISVLQAELRRANVTLDLLRANLHSYPEPPADLLADVDRAQVEVEKNLSKIRRVKRTGKDLLFVGLATLAGCTLIRSRRR